MKTTTTHLDHLDVAARSGGSIGGPYPMTTIQRARQIQTTNGLRHRPAIFTDEAAAHRWSAACDKPQRVVLGDCPKYWVVCPADAERLRRGGYEVTW